MNFTEEDMGLLQKASHLYNCWVEGEAFTAGQEDVLHELRDFFVSVPAGGSVYNTKYFYEYAKKEDLAEYVETIEDILIENNKWISEEFEKCRDKEVVDFSFALALKELGIGENLVNDNRFETASR